MKNIALHTYVIIMLLIPKISDSCHDFPIVDILVIKDNLPPNDSSLIHLILPAKSDSLFFYEFLSADMNANIPNKTLKSKPSKKQLYLNFHNKGKYYVHLVLKDKHLNPRFICSETINVNKKDSWFWNEQIYGTLAGSIVGALLTLFAFIFKRKWTKNDIYKEKQKQIKMQFQQLLYDIKKDIENDRVKDLPTWLSDPSSPTWSPEFQAPPYKKLISDLIRKHRDWQIKGLSNSEYLNVIKSFIIELKQITN